MANDVKGAPGSVILIREASMARLVINRPKRRNALSLEMWRTIPTLIAEIEADRSTIAVLVEGGGTEAFAAGADISELEACVDEPDRGLAYMKAVEDGTEALASLSPPTIALIRGFCIGAGIEIAMTCDRRFATPDSRFGTPPSKLGVTYSLTSTARLLSLVGRSAARDLLFSAREVGAVEALKLGLIDEIADRGDIDGVVLNYVTRLSSLSRFSNRVAKEIIRSVEAGAIFESDHIRKNRIEAFSGRDFREGVIAFREKRKPSFS